MREFENLVQQKEKENCEIKLMMKCRSRTRGQQHCVCYSAETQNLPLDTILMLNQELSISTICL